MYSPPSNAACEATIRSAPGPNRKPTDRRLLFVFLNGLFAIRVCAVRLPSPSKNADGPASFLKEFSPLRPSRPSARRQIKASPQSLNYSLFVRPSASVRSPFLPSKLRALRPPTLRNAHGLYKSRKRFFLGENVNVSTFVLEAQSFRRLTDGRS